MIVIARTDMFLMSIKPYLVVVWLCTFLVKCLTWNIWPTTQSIHHIRSKYGHYSPHTLHPSFGVQNLLQNVLVASPSTKKLKTLSTEPPTDYCQYFQWQVIIDLLLNIFSSVPSSQNIAPTADLEDDNENMPVLGNIDSTVHSSRRRQSTFLLLDIQFLAWPKRNIIQQWSFCFQDLQRGLTLKLAWFVLEILNSHLGLPMNMFSVHPCLSSRWWRIWCWSW